MSPLERESIDAREKLSETLQHLVAARDFSQSAETKRGLSIAITHTETALLWLRAVTE